MGHLSGNFRNLQNQAPEEFLEKEDFMEHIRHGIKRIGTSILLLLLKAPDSGKDQSPLYQGDAFKAGSTDVGDVSWLTPTAQIHVAAWPNGCPGHSWQNVSCDGSEIVPYKEHSREAVQHSDCSRLHL